MSGNDVNFIWVGSTLGQVHAACLRSFQRHGYNVVLHTFDPPADTPEGVSIFDASKLMRRDEVVAYRASGSLALTANIYRYRILREGLGIYVDCDVYCLRRFPDHDYLLGWESDHTICNAVMAAPSDSELVRQLNAAAGDRAFIPPWRSKRRQRIMRFRKAIGIPETPEQMPWGTLGPKLLTYCVESLGLHDVVQPIDAFYPLHFSHTPLLRDPSLKLADLVTPRSFALHLCHSRLDREAIPKGSPLDQLVSSQPSGHTIRPSLVLTAAANPQRGRG